MAYLNTPALRALGMSAPRPYRCERMGWTPAPGAGYSVEIAPGHCAVYEITPSAGVDSIGPWDRVRVSLDPRRP